MNKENKLVPKLRFPEFVNEGEWKDKKLGECFLERQETGYHDLPLLSLTDKDGIVLQKYTNRKNNSSADKSKYLRVCVGDVAYNTMRMWEGRSAYVCIEGLVSPAYTVCIPKKDSIDGLFFFYYFKTNLLIQEFNRYSQGLVNDTLSLKYETFSKIRVLKPEFIEQKKIASCLTSVDELIAAHTDKLETLKVHKKGLMQQLFPAKGESAPKLRIAKEINGNWIKVSFNELFHRIVRKNKENNQNVLTISAQYGLINQLEFFNKSVAGKKLTGYYLLKKNEFAYNKSYSQGYPMGAIKPLKKYEKGIVSTLYICFKAINVENVDFFEQYFEAGMLNNEIAQIAQEGARNHGLLNVSVSDFFNKIELRIPENLNERQKIADILTSIDEKIEAQMHKIEAIKEHKRGLMQRLFPVINE
jgi:type I restriction enzyme S subunit